MIIKNKLVLYLIIIQKILKIINLIKLKINQMLIIIQINFI
jgi:hypothetical protein